jgi:Tol biopolymer transport system component
VVKHELVHVFTYSKLLAHGRNLGVWERRNPPSWFTEGLAEWWAEGWDTEAEMVIRDALLHDHLIPLENLNLGAGFLLYKEGQSFMRYFEQIYGADRIRLIMEEFYHYDTFEEVITAVTKVPYSEITHNWRLSLKKAAGGSLVMQDMPSVNSSRFTNGGANVSPAYYHDASGKSHVVYLSSRDGYTNVYRQRLGASQGSVLIKGEKTPELESLHFLQSGLSISSENVLAFSAKSFERDRIRLVNLETMEELGSIDDSTLTTMRSPAWSSDGEKIVFTAQNQGGQSDLYLWQSSNKSVTAITNDTYVDQDPIFGPDNKGIIFSSDRNRELLDGSTNLFFIDLADSSITRFTSGFYRDRKPKWSITNPNRLRFVSDRSGTPNIWEFALEDSAMKPLTNLHTGAVDFLDWNSDSLLITAFAGYNFQLHLAPIIESGDSLNTYAQQSPISNWQLPRYEGWVTRDSHPYRMQYSFDLAQTAVAYDPTFGFIGGTQVAISDMLGNRYYHILVANTAQTSTDFASHFNFAVSMANLKKRINHSVAVFRFANEIFNLEDTLPYFERSLGVRGALNYPVNIFSRVELSSTLWQSDREYWEGTGTREKVTLLSTFVSLVNDNSLWSATGPVDGWRFRVTVGQTYDFTKKQNYNYSALLDNRFYIRILRRMTFAQRSMLWYSDGRDVRQYRIGGSWGMRGYQFSEIKGRKYAMFNQELRFPFARSLVLRGSSYAVGMAPLTGAFFFDVGNAWNDEAPSMLGSYGFGIRALFMGALVLRWEFGRKTDFNSKDTETFRQFFFGWDY